MKTINSKKVRKLQEKFIWFEGMNDTNIEHWGLLKDKPTYYWKEANSYIWNDPLGIYMWCISRPYYESHI